MGTQLNEIKTEDLKVIVPSIFATRRNSQMSEKYVHVRTADIIEQVRENGFVVTQAEQDTARQRDPQYVRHMVHLTHKSLIGQSSGTVPQMLLENSGNGRTMFRGRAGFYRFVCLNGMVVGSNFEHVEIIHMRDIEIQVKKLIERIQIQCERGLNVIEDWKVINLTAYKQTHLAKQATVLRFGKEGAKAWNHKELLAVNRDEDKGDDLWHVFNRVQEGIIHCGMTGTSANNNPMTSRELKGISSQNDLNRGLWDLAEKIAA